MNEGLEERNWDDPLLEAAPAAKATAPPPVLTARGWLRLAYAIEFLIALLAVFTLWSEVGGQGHLDLMPWYVKLVCVLGATWCCVRFTAAVVEQAAAWNRRSVRWLVAILFFGLAMGAITYYYHLHEEDQDDSEDATARVSVTPNDAHHRPRV